MKFIQRYVELPRHGIKLAYLESGSPALPTLVFIHGLRGNSRTLEKFARHLKGVHLILIDLPGYGKTPPLAGRHTLKNIGSALAEFFEVAKLQNVVLAGYSIGGTVAFATARYFPAHIARLILITPALVRGGALLWLLKHYYNFYARLPRRWQRFLMTNYPLMVFGSSLVLTTDDAAVRKNYFDTAHASSRLINPRTVAEVSQDMTRADLKVTAGQLRMPTLVIGAELDTLTPVEFLRRVAGTIERAEFRVIHGSGHLLPVESPLELAAVINDYLADK